MKKTFQNLSLFLSAFLVLSCTACGNDTGKNPAEAKYADLVLGQDYTDLKAKLTVMTNRTDLIADDPNVRDFQDYTREFNTLYPNVEILFEAMPDYDLDMRTRLDQPSWDVCLIPTDMKPEELDSHFEPFCEYDDLADKYEFIELNTHNGKVYGIPSSISVQGIVYNKKVWQDAGITQMPETPDEFLAALAQIKANTDAIPLYTNYADGWTLNAWDYCDTGATANGRYRYYTMPFETDPFRKHDDGSGIYEVYHVLYEAAASGLTEDDPKATNWELCKASINNGEIGCMMLGSWSVPQMQSAGSHPEDIGYMPFPIQVNGKQYATTGADFSYGINNKVSDENKLASKLFVKFLIEDSGYAFDQGGISIVKGSEYSDVFAEFEGVQLIMEEQSSDGEENVFAEINEAAGVGLDSTPDHVMRIIDSARSGSESFDDIMNDWNAAWTAAQQQCLPAE